MTQQNQSMVTIPLKEYEELKTIKELKLKDGIAIREEFSHHSIYGTTEFPNKIYGGDGVIKILIEMIKSDNIEIERIRNKYNNIPYKIREKYNQ